MPSRSIVSRAARAVGTTRSPSASSSSSTGVAIASISGHDEQFRAGARALGLEQLAQRLRVGHVDDGRAVGDLHRRRSGVAVDGEDLAAQPLGLEHDLPARARPSRAGRGARRPAVPGVPITMLMSGAAYARGAGRARGRRIPSASWRSPRSLTARGTSSTRSEASSTASPRSSLIPLLLGMAAFVGYLSLRAKALHNTLRAAYPDEEIPYRLDLGRLHRRLRLQQRRPRSRRRRHQALPRQDVGAELALSGGRGHVRRRADLRSRRSRSPSCCSRSPRASSPSRRTSRTSTRSTCRSSRRTRSSRSSWSRRSRCSSSRCSRGSRDASSRSG